MKVIIAGSRNIVDYDKVLNTIIDSEFIISEIVSGTANGVDSIGEQIAAEFNIPLKQFPADWNKYDKALAGFIRNEQMAMYADALIAIWDGRSSGTKNMIKLAKALSLKIYIGN